MSLPGSKSLTNRALVLAALADGPSVVRRALRSRDTELMAGALVSLGTRIDTSGDDWLVTPAALTGGVDVDCGLAGTVMRFVPPVAGLADGDVAFDGDPHMRTRPVGQVLTALRALGVRITGDSLPFTVAGVGHVRGGKVVLDASGSSQFVSALLLAGARFDDGVDVLHDGKPVPSQPHVDMTVAMLREHGVEVDDTEPSRWRVAPGKVSRRRPPDRAGPVQRRAVPGAGRDHRWERSPSATGRGRRPRPATSCATCSPGWAAPSTSATPGSPSAATAASRGSTPTCTTSASSPRSLAALCALADGPSYLRGIAHIRGHETDRLTALATELRGLGADVTEHADGLELRPATLHGGLFHTYADHRMAHAAAVLGLGRRGRRGRRRRRDEQDVPGLPGRLGSPAGRPMSGRYDEHDHEHYERPRRRTRPRTKERPSYDDAVEGVVTTVDRGRFTLLVDGVTVWAVKARPLGRKGVVVGDRVRVVGDVSGEDGALARIVEVQERDDGAPAYGGRRRPGRARGRRQRRPARRGHRARRPRAAAAADRPGTGGGVRRGHEALAVPDQGRPGRPRDPAVHLPLARACRGW